MNYLYPIIIAASGVGWLSSKNQCNDRKNLAREVAVRDAEIASLREKLSRARLDYITHVSNSEAIIDSLNREIKMLESDNMELDKNLARNMYIERERTIDLAIAELEKLRRADDNEVD